MLAVDENTVLFKTFYFKAKVLLKILNYIYIFVYYFKLVLIIFFLLLKHAMKYLPSHGDDLLFCLSFFSVGNILETN